MSLDCGRKPECPERTHADTGRTCKLRTERLPRPGSNRQPSCCEARVLTTTPPCRPFGWVDFGSDVSAVEDFNKLLDDLMAVRRAWLRMERRALFCPCVDFHGPLHPRRPPFCFCDDYYGPLHPRMAERDPQLCMKIWREIPSSVKKLVVSAVDDWINSLDDQFTRMATRSRKSSYADVSMRSDPTIPIRCHSLPRLESIESSDFGVPFGINRYSSLPRMAEREAQRDKEMMAEEMAQLRMEMMAEREAQRDKERMAEEMAQREKEMMAEEMAQLRMEMMAEREAQRDKERMAEEMAQLRMEMMAEETAQREKESSEQQQRPHSAGTSVNMGANSLMCLAQVSSSFDVPIRRHSFNKLMDFDSDVSDVKDLNKPLDSQKEMNQELSSEVGSQHG